MLIHIGAPCLPVSLSVQDRRLRSTQAISGAIGVQEGTLPGRVGNSGSLKILLAKD